MTQARFFQCSLALPPLVWLIAAGAVSITQRESAGSLSENIIGGYRVLVPYLIFAAAAWRIARGQSYRTLILLSAVMPFVWGIFFALFYVVITLLVERIMPKWYVPLIMAFWAILVAWLAELIPLVLLMLFKNDFRQESEPGNQGASLM